MGLLNRIFGGKKNLAKEISLDAEKIKQIWADYLVSFDKKKEIVSGREFGIGNMGRPMNLDNVLLLEGLISRELVDVAAVDKSEKEIIDDLNVLSSGKQWSKLDDLRSEFTFERNVEPQVKKFLKKLKEVLETEFQVIQIMKNNPAKASDLAYKLGELVRETENVILWALNTSVESEIAKVNRALMKILSGGAPAKKKPELKIKPSRDSIDLARDMAAHWRGEPLLSDIINDDEALAKIILDANPELSPKKVNEVIVALRDNLDEPEDLD